MTINARKRWPRPTYTADEIRSHKEEYREYKRQMKSGWEKQPYNEFLDLVVDRLNPSLKKDEPTCPSCGSKNIQNHGGWETSVGGIGDIDPNHHWDACQCLSCGFRFTMEYKGIRSNEYNVWYTTRTERGSKLLSGLPTCHESYIHTCKHCFGDVYRIRYKKGTRTETDILSWGPNGEQQYDTFYKCERCNIEVQCSNDYYRESTPHRPRKPFGPHKHFSRFLPVIYEEVGIVVVSSYDKINIPETVVD